MAIALVAEVAKAKFLLENYNYERKETFLPGGESAGIADLKAILLQLESEEETGNLKKRSASAVKLFQAMAEQRQITLK